MHICHWCFAISPGVPVGHMMGLFIGYRCWCWCCCWCYWWLLYFHDGWHWYVAACYLLMNSSFIFNHPWKGGIIRYRWFLRHPLSWTSVHTRTWLIIHDSTGVPWCAWSWIWRMSVLSSLEMAGIFQCVGYNFEDCVVWYDWVCVSEQLYSQ